MTIPREKLHEILREMTKDTFGAGVDKINAFIETPTHSIHQVYIVQDAVQSMKEILFSDEIILACVKDYVFRDDDQLDEAEDKDTAISRTLSVSGQDYEVWVYLDGGFTIYDTEGENILMATDTGIATIGEDGSYWTDNAKLCAAVRACYGIGEPNATT